jgi:hypothetical protein
MTDWPSPSETIIDTPDFKVSTTSYGTHLLLAMSYEVDKSLPAPLLAPPFGTHTYLDKAAARKLHGALSRFLED